MRKLMLAMVFPFAASCAHADDLKKLDRLCKDAGANAASAEDDKSAWKMWTAKGTQVHFSYSAVIDTCVGTRVDYLRNEWDIQDVTGGFMNFHSLFDCSKSGAFNALIDKVRAYNGRIDDKGYSLWADNCEGGPSSAVQTPASEYSRKKCVALFKHKLDELHLFDVPSTD